MRKLAAHKPKDIQFDTSLKVTWRDGDVSLFSFWTLRTLCPCASCYDEITGKKILDDSKLDPNLYPLNIEYIGNYAIRIHWSDGHNTGMYTFKNLKYKLARISALLHKDVLE